jgi:hypothetical protein
MAVPRPQEPKEWVKPEKQEEYEQELHWQGFVVPSKWTDADLTKHPSIMTDLQTLEKYLLPVFWDFNQKSKYYQSRYYYYQRIFLVAALLTTLISVLNSYIYAVGGTRIDTILPASQLNFFLGFCTAIISARASYYTLLANYGEPRQRWAQYRRLTEELRSTYFKYLARLEKFQGPHRVQELRRKVLTLRQQEQQDG